jgi:hypothetical protein
MDKSNLTESDGYMIVYTWNSPFRKMGRSFIPIHGAEENLYEEIIILFNKFIEEGKIRGVERISINKNYIQGPSSYTFDEAVNYLNEKWKILINESN